MLTAVTGIYQDGKIELLETPAEIKNGASVVVTFLDTCQAKPEKEFLDLHGAWAGEFPDDFDLDAFLKEVGSEWEKEWEGEEIA